MWFLPAESCSLDNFDDVFFPTLSHCSFFCKLYSPDKIRGVGLL